MDNHQTNKGWIFFEVVLLLVALWFVLFLPAWTIDFYQAWMFWLPFSAAILYITIYFLKKNPKLISSRIKGGPIFEKEKKQKIIQLFSNIFWFLLFITPGIDHRFHWSNVPPHLVVIGDISVFLGLTIIFLALKENLFASGIIEKNKEQKVIMTGPYQIVRHPMYTGGLFLESCIPLALGSYWALLFSFLLFVKMIIRLFYEEKFLKENLPCYKKYCEKTPYRLIPYFW